LLDSWNEQRRVLAALYDVELSSSPISVQIPIERPWCHHVYHLYVIQAEKRDRLQEFLAGKGIQTQIHYESLVTDQPYYHRQSPGEFIGASGANKKILSLPLFPGMTEEQVKHVCASIREFYGW